MSGTIAVTIGDPRPSRPTVNTHHPAGRDGSGGDDGSPTHQGDGYGVEGLPCAGARRQNPFPRGRGARGRPVRSVPAERGRASAGAGQALTPTPLPRGEGLFPLHQVSTALTTRIKRSSSSSLIR
ncbi:hypothetical protein GCM10011322_01790 [Salinarimonas ramus]|uniref:Uncharacterized protein n=1 Tax=Salinarimonas ramus TaxID=690164 RepID=A0A917Q3J1_9HYPH|nr:hypothetical protein GCM10011322_01790 [Salinarimonas ramus]